MKSSRVFLFCLLSFIFGIFLSSFIKIPKVSIQIALFLGILLILIFIFSRKQKVVIVGLCILFLAGGSWRYQMAEYKIESSLLRQLNNSDRKVTLYGNIAKEPDLRESTQKLTIGIERIDTDFPISNANFTKGRILVTTTRYPEYRYGDELKITGRLLEPKEFEGFNYRGYLAKDGVYSVMDWPKIRLIKTQNYSSYFSLIYSRILNFKNKLREAIYQNLSPPQSSILGAMILGDKRKISDKWKNKLNIAGVRHITCVSGMHIVVLSGVLMEILIALGLWRRQAFYLVVILLFLFIIMVGFPASAIRAGVMSFIFLLGQQIGRLRSSGRAIAFAGAAMLFQNPLLLKYDVGFQLSFLATIGIVYLYPSFKRILRKMPDIMHLRNILSMTLAAQIFTLPIIIYNFGYFSLFSPITNFLIIPVLPWILGLGFLFVLLGVIFEPLALILLFPVWFLLTYVVKIVDLVSKAPFLTIENLHWLWIILLYLFLTYFTYRMVKKEEIY